MNKKYAALCLTLAIPLVFAACGKTDSNKSGDTAAASETPAQKKDPVTLKFYNWGNYTDPEFQKLVLEPVQKKYPYISFEQIKRGKGFNPDEIVASGTDVDLIVTNNDTLDVFGKVSLLYDMAPDIKKANIDMKRFEKAGTDRSMLNGQTVGLPFSIGYGGMFYNKNIFDKFGVPYPKDGMSWDELLDLTKKMTRQYEGVQYRGFDPQSFGGLKAALPVDFLDPKTDKASLNNDLFKMALNLHVALQSIPGNAQKGTAFVDVSNAFLKDQNVAMTIAGVLGLLDEATKNGFTWDIAQTPYYKGYPNIGGAGQTTVLSIASISKHKDDAMKVIQVLTSDEVQTISSSQFGKPTSLSSQTVKDSYGKEMPFLKGKNVQSIFKSKPPEVYAISPYSRDVSTIFNDKLKLLIAGQLDVNSLITQTEDEINKKVDLLKAGK